MIVQINRKDAKTQRLGALGLFASLRLCGESFSATAPVSSFGCGSAALCLCGESDLLSAIEGNRQAG
jgi:hypothetical protein